LHGFLRQGTPNDIGAVENN